MKKIGKRECTEIMLGLLSDKEQPSPLFSEAVNVDMERRTIHKKIDRAALGTHSVLYRTITPNFISAWCMMITVFQVIPSVTVFVFCRYLNSG